MAYPNEVLTVRLFCGGGLVLLANVLLQLPWGLRPRSAAPKSAA